MEELKICPFCGSRGILEHKKVLGTWIVQCLNGCCPASFMIGWDYDTQDEAIEVWNRRVDDGKE